MIPRIREKNDSPNEDWVCFYIFVFNFGFRFPIARFVKEILVYYDLAPTHLMPHTWRILLGIKVLTKKLRIEFLISL